MNNKSQISGTMVMYIMSGVVIMLVIGFGISQMLSLQGTVSEINCLNFRQEFKERLIKARPLGNIDPDGVNVDCDTAMICFIDLDESAPNDDLSPIIIDSWNDEVKKNVFLMQDNLIYPSGSFYVKGLKPIGKGGESYLCVENDRGFLDIILQGKGRYVVVKEPSSQ